jgi:hypothetical protein
MILTISLFFIGILVAVGLIARKIWMLRSGQIIAGSYEEADWTDISIESIRVRLIDVLKFLVHYSVLYTLKAWILVSHFIKRCDKRIREKLMHVIHKNAHGDLDTSASPSGCASTKMRLSPSVKPKSRKSLGSSAF